MSSFAFLVLLIRQDYACLLFPELVGSVVSGFCPFSELIVYIGPLNVVFQTKLSSLGQRKNNWSSIVSRDVKCYSISRLIVTFNFQREKHFLFFKLLFYQRPRTFSATAISRCHSFLIYFLCERQALHRQNDGAEQQSLNHLLHNLK